MINMLPNEQLRRERQRRGWSRQYVAEQIGVADPKTIGRWERGVAFPSSYFLQKLCTLFGMLAQDLGLCPHELLHDNHVQKQFSDGILWASLRLRPNVSNLLGRWGSFLAMPVAEIALLQEEAHAQPGKM